MPNDFKRLDCVEFFEKYGRNHRPNEYGDVYDRAVEETLNAATKPAPAYGIDIPDWSEEDPASLEAWFGNYSFFDHYRKVVLSNCMEIERAKATAASEKITETRLESLARLHPNYQQFLADSLQGRTARERNVRDSLRNGL